MKRPDPPCDTAPAKQLAASAALALPTGPLAFLDLRNIYAQWWPLVDFAVFVAIFVGIAHATLAKRFEGRGGSLVTVGVGAMLAFGAVGAEWTYQFNLASLAPLATLIIFGLLGLTLVQLVVSFGCRPGTAVAIALVILGICVSLVSPQFGEAFSWVRDVLQLGAIGAVLFVVARGVFGQDGVRGSERLQRLGGILKSGPSPEPDPAAAWLRDQKEPLRLEKRSLAGALKPITKQERKAAQRILRELGLVRQVLARGPPSAEDRQAIAGALARIPPARHDLAELVQRVKERSKSLEEFDSRVLSEAGAVPSGASVKEGSALYRVTVDQRQKVELERRLTYLEGFVEKYDLNAGASVQRSAELLLSGDLPGARKWLDEAVKYEEEALRMIERTRGLEKMLLRVTRREVREAKRAT